MTTAVSHEPEVCFICLESEAAGPLHSPCACPRKVHPYCLARWQLQCAGKEEEKYCRFCKHNLPSWKDAFANDDVTDAVPVMSIHFNNSTYWLKVHPGQEGLSRFKADIRQLLGLAEHMHFDITFECKVPGADGARMELRGLDAFDAAVYCASLTAAERRKARSSSSKDKHGSSSTSSSSSSSIEGGAEGDVDEGDTSMPGGAGRPGALAAAAAANLPGGHWSPSSRLNNPQDSWISGAAAGAGSSAGTTTAAAGAGAGAGSRSSGRGGRHSSSRGGSDAGGGEVVGRLGWKQLSKLFSSRKKRTTTPASTSSGSDESSVGSSSRRAGRTSSSDSIMSADGVTQVVTPGFGRPGGDLPLFRSKAKQLLPGRLLKRLTAALVRHRL